MTDTADLERRLRAAAGNNRKSLGMEAADALAAQQREIERLRADLHKALDDAIEAAGCAIAVQDELHEATMAMNDLRIDNTITLAEEIKEMKEGAEQAILLAHNLHQRISMMQPHDGTSQTSVRNTSLTALKNESSALIARLLAQFTNTTKSSIDEQIAKAQKELAALPPKVRAGNQLEGFDAHAAIDEALNMGDGSYKP